MWVKRSVANTAAASVDETTAPSRMASSHESSNSARGDTGDEGADDHTDGAEQRCRHRHLAEPPPRGLEPALVENQRQSGDPDLARQLGVVELDPARPIGAQQHSEAQERDQDRQAGARGAERDDDAGAENRTYEQEEEPFVHERIFSGHTLFGRRRRLGPFA